MKDSFIFYRSFYEAIKVFEQKKQLEILTAIIELGLNQKESDLQGYEGGVMALITPQITANHRRGYGGKYGILGGRPKKNKPIGLLEQKPIGLSENNPNVNVNVNVNDNNKKNECTHKLQNWIKERLPNVSKLKTQLTFDECEKLKTKYSNDQIGRTLEAMENKKDLVKCYNSVYLTLNNWLKRDSK